MTSKEVMLLMDGAVFQQDTGQAARDTLCFRPFHKTRQLLYLWWEQSKPCSSFHVLDVPVVESLHS